LSILTRIFEQALAKKGGGGGGGSSVATANSQDALNTGVDEPSPLAADSEEQDWA
jgi:hypothetical protein